MTDHTYILNDLGQPVIEPDLLKWAEWYGAIKFRTVKQEWVGNIHVSTVFLGIDHNFSHQGPPVLWETMLFSNQKLDRKTWRCAGNREQAEAQHDRIVNELKSGQGAQT